MPETPSLRAFLRANPGAVTTHTRPNLFVLIITVAVAAIWALVLVGAVLAWHANGWRGVADLLAPELEGLLMLVGATLFVLAAIWFEVVRSWLLCRPSWALSSDAWLLTSVKGERRLIPFSRIVEVKEYYSGLGFVFDDDELQKFYHSYNGTTRLDARLLQREMTQRLDLMNFTVWERTKPPDDYKSPIVYRRCT